MVVYDNPGGAVLFTLCLSGSVFCVGVVTYFVVRPMFRAIYWPRVSQRVQSQSLFGWIRPIMKATDADVARQAGMYGLLYTRLSAYFLLYALFCSVVGAMVVIPLNMLVNSKQKDAQTSGLVSTFGVSITGDSRLLWVYASLLGLFSFVGYYVIIRWQAEYFLIRRWYRQTGDPEFFTCEVRHVPNGVSASHIKSFFAVLYSVGTVASVHVAYDLHALFALKAKKKALLRDIRRLEWHNDQSGIRARLHPFVMLGKTGFALHWLLSGLGCTCLEQDIDALVETRRRLTRVNEEIVAMEADVYQAAASRQMISNLADVVNTVKFQSTGLVYVTFHTTAAATRFRRDFSSPRAVGALIRRNKPSHELTKYIKPLKWHVVEAPAPKDIWWANLSYSWTRRAFRTACIGVLVVLFALFVAIPIAYLATLTQQLHLPTNLQRFISGYLPTMSIAFLQATLPVVMEQVCRFEKHHTKSGWCHSIMRWYFLYIILNVVVFQTILQGGMQRVYIMWTDPEADIPSFFSGVNYVTQGPFFIAYLIQLTLLASCFHLLRVFDISELGLFRLFLDVTDQDKSNSNRIAITPMRYYYRVSEMILVVAIMLMFAVIVPVILPVALMYFIIRRYIDMNNMMMVCPNESHDGRMCRRVTHYFVFAILLSQLAMMAFVYWKGNFSISFCVAFMPIISIFVVCLLEYRFYNDEHIRKYEPENAAAMDAAATRRFSRRTISPDSQLSSDEALMRDSMDVAYLHKALKPIDDHDIGLDFDEANVRDDDEDDGSDGAEDDEDEMGDVLEGDAGESGVVSGGIGRGAGVHRRRRNSVAGPGDGSSPLDGIDSLEVIPSLGLSNLSAGAHTAGNMIRGITSRFIGGSAYERMDDELDGSGEGPSVEMVSAQSLERYDDDY